MSELQPIEQLAGESRADYVARVSTLTETERLRVGAARQRFNRGFLGGLRWLLVSFFRHWLLLSNLFYAYILLAATLLGPWLLRNGQVGAGTWLFNSLSLICDQVPTHSYYVFGYQMCLCQRCLAIYSAMLTGGLIYAGLRRGRRIQYVPWRWLILLSVPLLLDGLTQMLGWRESNPWLRSFTGGLFGFAYVATVYPWFDAVARKLFRLWGVGAEDVTAVPSAANG